MLNEEVEREIGVLLEKAGWTLQRHVNSYECLSPQEITDIRQVDPHFRKSFLGTMWQSKGKKFQLFIVVYDGCTLLLFFRRRPNPLHNCFRVFEVLGKKEVPYLEFFQQCNKLCTKVKSPEPVISPRRRGKRH